MGYVNCLKGNYEIAIQQFSEAVAQRKEILNGKAKDSLIAGYINNLGSAYFLNKNY